MRYRVKVNGVRIDGVERSAGYEFDGGTTSTDERDLKILQKLNRIEQAPEKTTRRKAAETSKAETPTEATGEYSRRDMQAQSIPQRSADDAESS